MYENSFGRILGVLVSPGKTFRSIAERPAWVAPLLVLVLLSGAMATLITQRIDMADVVRHRMEESGRQVSQEDLDRGIEVAERFGWIFGLIPVVVAPIAYLAGAAVFFGIFRLLGSNLTFKQAFAAFLYAMAPGVVAALLAVPIILSRQSLSIEELQSGTILMSNLGAFAPEDSGPVLKAALSAIDVFTLWTLALLAIGYRIVARVSAATATATVAVLWLIFVGLKVGRAALFG
jgi:hypothetical protein